ncbi:MAG: hypothetical protein WCC81_00325 [Pseudolabrys sp.]
MSTPFHMAHADKVTFSKLATDNIAKKRRLHADESRLYFGTSEHSAAHKTIRNYSGEYVRGDLHTNSADSGPFQTR